MNCTQNKKIEQVKETTMIVGIDVGSEKHYFRAFNWRGIELTRKPVAFSNSMEGFNSFYNTIVELIQKSELEEALVGIEPTGHYWFDLGQFMGEKNIKFVMVNPHHVHKSKELDDNSPSKNDRKDPRVIAGLVRDGRYFLSDCQSSGFRGVQRDKLQLISVNICHRVYMRHKRRARYAAVSVKIYQNITVCL